MLDNYGKISKIGLECCITLSFKISHTAKLFGEKPNDYIKHFIVISTKDVIYQKLKNGDQMCLSDVKRSI